MLTTSDLANELILGSVFDRLGREGGGFDLVDHWSQGEFHHDVIVRVHRPTGLPGAVLVIATNCNGGVKEILCFDDVPERDALWHSRCPENPEFVGTLGPVLDRATTVHYFDPCVLLTESARSELLPQHRTRQRGGGWCRRET